MGKEVAFFSVCNISYFPKAIVLAKSLYKTEGAKLIIYLADGKTSCLPLSDCYDIRWLSEEQIPSFEHLAFMYDVTELCTCVKPYITIKLLKTFRYVVYLDPDICIYSGFSDLYEELEKYPVLLTPHYTTPIDDPRSEYDIGMMRFGSFNLGFYAVNSSTESMAFLAWWSLRCLTLGFAEAQFGLSVDQKWVSIAPCFFRNIKVLFDLGLNMAFWNLHERSLSACGGVFLVNQQCRLKFFHFSSFDINNPRIVSSRPHSWNKTGRQDLNDICDNYAAALRENDFGLSAHRYVFDYMSNGDYISPTLRRAYASVYNELQISHDPFDSSGIVGRFARKNGLLEARNRPYRPLYESDLHGVSVRFKMITVVLRGLLRIVGPNMFANVSRLLVFVSSSRKNRFLWRL
jgi:hypothetical protein